jgi:hypothetical protein
MSAPVPVFTGCVTEAGVLKLDQRARFLAYAESFAGQRVEVTIRRRKEQRTSRQNRYLFGVVYPVIAEFTGYDVDELHEALAMRFLRIEDCPITGAPRRKRTPKTNTAEFAAYVDQVIRFGVGLGLYIPAPGEAEAA